MSVMIPVNISRPSPKSAFPNVLTGRLRADKTACLAQNDTASHSLLSCLNWDWRMPGHHHKEIITKSGSHTQRVFLFLQGPHGPFFDRLGAMLRIAGATVLRVGFNAGDQAFWRDGKSYVPFVGRPEIWPETISDLLDGRGVTDVVLYGDTRSHHVEAIQAAKARGVTVHVFEEGYMRPYWVTYERGGSNGHSRLMNLTIADMRRALAETDAEAPLPPAHWGDMRQHMLYGALYHLLTMLRQRAYPKFRSHRQEALPREAWLNIRRFLMLPAHAIERQTATRRIHRGGFPYHLVLLQLEHDSSFQEHSPFSTMYDFVAEVISGFKAGSEPHHHLVFKAHPLEDGRTPLRQDIRRVARQHGLSARVHFVRGGKLARLLDDARSAVTVNSTSGQQALWRGLPLKAFGKTIYGKPELISDLPLATFFSQPSHPDTRAYRYYRRFLLQTSQVPGGFYSVSGRRRLLRHIVDMVLSDSDPYNALTEDTEAARQQLRLVL